MKKTYKIIFFSLFLVFGLSVLVWRNWTMENVAPNNTNPPPQNPDITITTPLPGAMVENSIFVSGSAKGTWYFEASFPVRVEDANGLVLGQAPATAQGEWMTTSTVPFVGTVTFATATTANGFVIFAKDNPSGLPEYDAEVRVPVIFSF